MCFCFTNVLQSHYAAVHDGHLYQERLFTDWQRDWQGGSVCFRGVNAIFAEKSLYHGCTKHERYEYVY